MISKLPRWAWIGAPVLTFSAGIINAIGFLGWQHQGVTHLTGTTTLAGIAVAGREVPNTVHLFVMIAAFVAGAIASGFIIQNGTLQLGRRYGVALSIESALLLIAVRLLQSGSLGGEYFASAAAGLQNAMVSTYSGAVLRTTHVSGMFTDLGIALGHLLRGMAIDWLRMRFWLAMIVAFFFGGVAGSILFERMAFGALYIPAAITGVTGASYAIYRHFKLRGRPSDD